MEIHKVLEERLHPCDDGTDRFRYEDGWSDERVSQSIDERLTKSSTATVRKEMFGELKKAYNVRSRHRLGGRITALENQLRRLLQLTLCADDAALVLGNNEDNITPAE